MTIVLGEKRVEDVGSWQQFFVPTCAERIQKAKKRAVKNPGICLERAHAEMKAYEQYKNEPRVIQRARVFETYLREKTIFILEDELIVGNVTSKVRGSPIFAELVSHWLEKELDDPVKDPGARQQERHVILPEERQELRNVIFPYFKGKVSDDDISERTFGEVRGQFSTMATSCPHLPSPGGSAGDVGHQQANYEKVLLKGLKGIREEVEWYVAQLEQPYMHYMVQERRDFYNAVLITLDAAMAYARRYADLAREMAAKEADPKRKLELNRIADVCYQVPANPARDWWEAVQAVFMIQVLLHCEQYISGQSFGRFDQYMYPFYKKSVIDEKVISRDEALELLEFLWVKTNEYTGLFSYEGARAAAGFSTSQNINTGGQTRDGKDACNEVTMLCLESEEQVGLVQPEISMRIWEGTPDKYLKKAAEVIRLGRGKLKFFGDRQAMRMAAKAYPDMTKEDIRDYAVIGCIELNMPHVSQLALCGNGIAPKFLELVLNNGKCALCGQQIGPSTGDPRTFESMQGVRQAFREQVFYGTKHMAKGIKVSWENWACRLMIPFASALRDGPLQKGRDVVQGGAWFTTYGAGLYGLADAADSLAVIDKLIYRNKRITWNQLLEAVKANWNGYESLRQLCINGVPKYGNDNDYADEWAAWVMDTWYDSMDWINTQKDLLPKYGGIYIGCIQFGGGNVPTGMRVGSLPNGHIYPNPVADTMSPVQGVDKNGPTAVLKSVSKMPSHRFAMGTVLNQRLNPQLLATDRDLNNFVSYLRAFEELGLYHIQFNVVSSDLLRKAMKEPERYKDLIVRVASYCAYFADLCKEQQLDIIARTEQQGW